jgi:preprotein translocase subunit SecF
MTYSEAANLALNQTLVRSINTSVVALLPVAAILVIGVGFLGAGTLKDLALALFVGTLAGTYSSIFIATPVACQLQEQRPEMKALAARVEARRNAGEKAKASGRKGSDSADGESDLASVGAEATLAGLTGAAVTQTGPRQQPKKGTTRSQRKKR